MRQFQPPHPHLLDSFIIESPDTATVLAIFMMLSNYVEYNPVLGLALPSTTCVTLPSYFTSLGYCFFFLKVHWAMVAQIPFKCEIFLLFYFYCSHIFPYFEGSLVYNESREQLDDVTIVIEPAFLILSCSIILLWKIYQMSNRVGHGT